MRLTYLTIVRRLFATRQAEGRKILRPSASALKGDNGQGSSSRSFPKRGKGESGEEESKREESRRKRRVSFLPPLPNPLPRGERGRKEMGIMYKTILPVVIPATPGSGPGQAPGIQRIDTYFRRACPQLEQGYDEEKPSSGSSCM